MLSNNGKNGKDYDYNKRQIKACFSFLISLLNILDFC